MSDYYTENIADFGYRELEQLRDILTALLENGLPDDFYDEGVRPAFNRASGDVFLTNDEYQVCMEVDGKLESFYTSPYYGTEGFYEDLLEDAESWDADNADEDLEWLRDIAESRGDTEGVEKLNALIDAFNANNGIEESTRTSKQAVRSSRSTKRRFTVTAAKMSDDPTADADAVESVLKQYEGSFTNPKTGWSGTVTIKRDDKAAKDWSRDSDGIAYLWRLSFSGGDKSSSGEDLIVYWPQTMDGGQKFTIHPESGAPQFAKSLDEFKKLLRKEYSYLKKA